VERKQGDLGQHDSVELKQSPQSFEDSTGAPEPIAPQHKPASQKPKGKVQHDDEGMGWGHALTEDFMKFWLPAILIFVFVRGTIAEARYIPSGSMEPTLQIQDRILVDKVSPKLLGKPIGRRDIIVFYPPSIETGIPDPQNQWLNLIPFYPERPQAFIKRVVGVAGDRIEVRKGVGIFVNGKLVQEGANVPKPDYDLTSLGDIRGFSMIGEYLKPFGDSRAPIVVPPHELFVLGDNHTNSSDGHVWGFLEDNRVIGRACLTIWSNEWLSMLFHQ
jgi:signal peptidase I